MYRFTQEELRKIATAEPSTLSRMMGGLGRAAAGAAAVGLAGAAVDSVVNAAQFYGGRAVARNRFQGYIDGMDDYNRQQMFGQSSPEEIMGRFDSMYRLAPDYMRDPALAANAMAGTMMDQTVGLTPDAAREFVNLNSAMTGRGQAPGLFSQIGQQMGGALVSESVRQTMQPTKAEVEADREKELQQRLETDKKKIDYQAELRKQEIEDTRQYEKGRSEAQMAAQFKQREREISLQNRNRVNQMIFESDLRSARSPAPETTSHLPEYVGGKKLPIKPTKTASSPLNLFLEDQYAADAQLEADLNMLSFFAKKAHAKQEVRVKVVPNSELDKLMKAAATSYNQNKDLSGAAPDTKPEYDMRDESDSKGEVKGQATTAPGDKTDLKKSPRTNEDGEANKTANVWSGIGSSALKGVGVGAAGGAALGAAGGIASGDSVGGTLGRAAKGGVLGGLAGGAVGGGMGVRKSIKDSGLKGGEWWNVNKPFANRPGTAVKGSPHEKLPTPPAVKPPAVEKTSAAIPLSAVPGFALKGFATPAVPIGGVIGAASGAYNAPEGQRLGGALRSGLLGAGLGGATASLVRGGMGLYGRNLVNKSGITEDMVNMMHKGLKPDGKSLRSVQHDLMDQALVNKMDKVEQSLKAGA